jgi:hypothetical protein
VLTAMCASVWPMLRVSGAGRKSNLLSGDLDRVLPHRPKRRRHLFSTVIVHDVLLCRLTFFSFDVHFSFLPFAFRLLSFAFTFQVLSFKF